MNFIRIKKEEKPERDEKQEEQEEKQEKPKKQERRLKQEDVKYKIEYNLSIFSYKPYGRNPCHTGIQRNSKSF